MKVEYLKEDKVKNLKIEIGFVIAGDIHLYNHYPYSNPVSQHSSYSLRLNDINKALYACGRAAKQLELPLILNGDLLHTGSYDHATLHSLTMFLRSFHDVDMYINTGNHDLESGHSMIYPLVQFRDNPKHVVVTHPFISPIGGSKYNFAFMPFMSKEETIEHLKKLPLEIVDNYKYILIIHNTFASSRFANNAISASGISPNLALFKKYFMVIGSDVHKYQEFMHGRGFYTSSLIPLNFGERTKEHGFHIIDLKNKIRYFVIPNAPRFIQIEHSRLKTLSKTELKSKVRGNIIKVVDDGELGARSLNKEFVRDQLIKAGSLFVAFSSAKYGRSQTLRTPVVKSFENKQSIVSKYSKKLAQEHNLNSAKVEEIGINILKTAEIKSSREREEK